MPPSDNPYEGAIDFTPQDVQLGGECAFCDNRISVVNKHTFMQALFEVVTKDSMYLVCDDCWEIAYPNAPLGSVHVHDGVWTLLAGSR